MPPQKGGIFLEKNYRKGVNIMIEALDVYQRQVLDSADKRCLEGIINPCGVCRIQGQTTRTSLNNAKAIAQEYCPDGRMPEHLKRRLAASTR